MSKRWMSHVLILHISLRTPDRLHMSPNMTDQDLVFVFWPQEFKMNAATLIRGARSNFEMPFHDKFRAFINKRSLSLTVPVI